MAIADQQYLLQAILRYLDAQKAKGALKNNGIPSALFHPSLRVEQGTRPDAKYCQ